MAFSTTAITDKIKTFKDLQNYFNLTKAKDKTFFPEWREDLPELTDAEKAEIDSIKEIYDYQRLDGFLLEGTVNLIILSPLLKLAGFFESPYKIRSPYGVELEIPDPQETIRGFIDALVIHEQLWVLVVESKRNGISLVGAMPQLLSYMLTQPQPHRTVYGMATNGDDFVFLKLTLGENPEYDTSRTFSLMPAYHDLEVVLQILKKVGNAIS